MKTTTIKIDHPSDEILSLKDLREACFRITEHITQHWENIDLNMAYLTDWDRQMLSKTCTRAIEYAEKAAAMIKIINDHFGELPL